MAYPKVNPIVLPQASVATASAYVVTISSLGLTLIDDEWIFVFAAHSGTSAITPSGTGWTEVSDFTVTSGCRMGVYKCKVASGAVADLTLTPASGTNMWQAVLAQISDADADASAVVDTAWTTDNAGAAASLTPAAGTPVVDDCLVFYFGSCRTGSGKDTSIRFLSSDVVGQALDAIVTNTGTGMSICLGTVQQGTKVDTAKTMYSADSTNRLGIIRLAIKNKTSGKKSADCRAGITKLAWMGAFGVSNEGLSASTWNAANTPAAFCTWAGGTIGGITADSTVATASVTSSTNQLTFWGGATQLSSTVVVAAPGSIVGGWIATPATFDCTGKLLSIEWDVQNLPDEMMGEKGILLALGDNTAASTGNAVVFQLAPKQAIKPGLINYTSVISLETATQFESEGTIDTTFWQNIKKIGFFWHRSGNGSAAKVLKVRNVLLHSNSTMIGGNSARPLDVRFLDQALNGWGYKGCCDIQGDAVLVKTPIQFGDGSTATYVDTSGTLLNTPQPYSTITQPFNNITAGVLTVGLYASASDTINMISSADSSGEQQNFTINASSSASAISSFNGKAFKGWNMTWATNLPVIGAVYSNCDTVAFKGADVTGVTVSNTTAGSGEAACSWDANGAVVIDTTIDVTGSSAGYHIETGASLTSIKLTNVTFTGTPATDKIHVLKTSSTVSAGSFTVGEHYEIKTVGTTDFTLIGASANTIGVRFTATGIGSGTGDAYTAVKIIIEGTTSLSESDCTSAGAVVWVAAPSLYQSVTISGATSGSRIQIYDTTSSTELYNGTPTFPYTWTDSLAASATRDIRLRVSYVSGTTAKAFIEANIGTCGITSGTEDVSYLVNQVNDDSYNTNAIDGPAIYATSGITFTDAATDLVNCNIAGGTVTHKTIYACFVYWNFTSTGIANDFTYIDSPDPANYIYTSMKIKNTSSPVVPLSVSGGWGRDSSTGLSITLWESSGGAVGFAGDHAIAYSSGSGITSQDKTDIASEVLSQASTTPISSNVKKINSVTITGNGSTTPFNV